MMLKFFICPAGDAGQNEIKYDYDILYRDDKGEVIGRQLLKTVTKHLRPGGRR